MPYPNQNPNQVHPTNKRGNENSICTNGYFTGYYSRAKQARFKVLTKILQGLPPELADCSTRERSNYILKEYTDPKSILRAYLISPKKNALRSTTNFYAEEDKLPAIGPTSRYFEENDGGIYEPPFHNEDDKEEPPRVKRRGEEFLKDGE
ncbi:hypothetical protein QBC39DRAFT_327849 [Podospora conica]|nr:hypothetical protein QBC39DRAFT_327849 [Schizothecium conicum]